MCIGATILGGILVIGALAFIAYTPSGLSRGAINKAVKRTLADSERMTHIIKPKHGLSSVKNVGKLMKKTLINGTISQYGSLEVASAAFWSAMNSEVTFRMIGTAIMISDMWIRRG